MADVGEPAHVDDEAVVHPLPAARTLLVDEQGIGLRATWHHERNIVNLSIWRGGRCVETFRLTVADAGQLVGFLAAGLVHAATTGHRQTGGVLDRGRGPFPASVVDAVGRTSTGVRALRVRLASRIAPDPSV